MNFEARDHFLIPWPEMPLLRFAICFIAGIWVSDHVGANLCVNVAFFWILFTIYFVMQSRRVKSIYIIRYMSVLLWMLAFSTGLIRGELQKVDNDLLHYTQHVSKDNSIMIGVVSEVKRKKRISAMVDVQQIDGHSSRGRLLVYFSEKDSALQYEQGDILILEGNIRFIEDNANPKAFNYRSYMKYKGVPCQVFLKSGMHQRIGYNPPNIFIRTSSVIRQWALSIFESRISDQKQFATASAMVLGYRSDLSKDLYTTFSETGTVHVLAVSGLHVGIICMIIMFIFRRIKKDALWFKLIRLILLITAVWTYALVTGASPAVLRAAVMFSLLLIGKLWFEGVNVYNILACSAILILLYDPYLLFQLSFQFSYLALVSIMFFQPIIERWIDTRYRITTRIWQLATVSIAAQILVFPISVYHFHQFPTYFILSGVVAVFLAFFILSNGILLLCVDNILFLGDIVATIYSVLLEGFLTIIESIQSLPFNSVRNVSFSLLTVVLLYVVILAIMFLTSIRSRSFKDVIFPKIRRRKIFRWIIYTSTLLLIVNSMFRTYRIKNQSELIIYNIPKAGVLDIFDGVHHYAIQSEDIASEKVEFSCKSYRIYKGSTSPKYVSTFSSIDERYFHLNANGSLIFGEKHLFFADQFDLKSMFPCRSDVLLVINKTNQSPYEILQYHHTDLVVIDNSLPYRLRNQWLKECRLRGIAVHDIRRDGIFRLAG